MEDEKQLVFELPDDSLAQALEAGDVRANRRSIGGSTDRSRNGLAIRTRSSRWPTRRGLERVKIELDVGKLGHDPSADVNTR